MTHKCSSVNKLRRLASDSLILALDLPLSSAGECQQGGESRHEASASPAGGQLGHNSARVLGPILAAYYPSDKMHGRARIRGPRRFGENDLRKLGLSQPGGAARGEKRDHALRYRKAYKNRK